jgi:GDPmannose 4,6-dehydratase
VTSADPAAEPAEPGTAFITGATGQDGTYLAELLIGRGYRVYGMVSAQDDPGIERLRRLCPQVALVEGDLLDQASLVSALQASQPTEVYNLGALTSVGHSFEQALATAEVTGLGVLRLLEAVRAVDPAIRFWQASSSEVFGAATECPQVETTAFHPRSPYGAAKAYAHFITASYRERYGMFCCCGILYNHESPRRSLDFVTRKITNAVARIRFGQQSTLALGNLESRRDWGFAGDFVRAMHLMLQQPVADDYIVATGQAHSVRDFCEIAFQHAGLDYREHVVADPRFMRPVDVAEMCGDPSKAETGLGWSPSVGFASLVTMMVDHDMRLEESRLTSGGHGERPPTRRG